MGLHVNTLATVRWLVAMNKLEVSSVVLLDLKKTFDLVGHDILLKKLTIYHFLIIAW